MSEMGLAIAAVLVVGAFIFSFLMCMISLLLIKLMGFLLRDSSE